MAFVVYYSSSTTVLVLVAKLRMKLFVKSKVPWYHLSFGHYGTQDATAGVVVKKNLLDLAPSRYHFRLQIACLSWTFHMRSETHFFFPGASDRRAVHALLRFQKTEIIVGCTCIMIIYLFRCTLHQNLHTILRQQLWRPCRQQHVAALLYQVLASRS